MNVIYLDQNIVIELAEERAAFLRLRAGILDLVTAEKAIFPYSEIHLSESASMSPPSQRLIGEFWDTISRGYHFIASKEVRSSQFKDVFHGRKTRFRPHRVLFKDSLKFEESIDWRPDATIVKERSDRLREVVRHWSTLKRAQISGRIRKLEANALHKAVIEMLNRWIAGDVPRIGEINSEYNTIASDLSWEIRNKGDGAEPLLAAIAFMRDHAHDVPAIAIETAGLESLAEQYASDNKKRRAVSKSQLDHDSNDLAALSTFVPYCVAGVSDGNAVNVIRRAYKKLNLLPIRLFVQRDVKAFEEFLEGLPDPERLPDPKSEISKTDGRTLLVIPYQAGRQSRDLLVSREAFPTDCGVQRAILPLGGLKAWSESTCEWSTLLEVLESFAGGVEVASGGQDLTLSGGNNEKGLLFQIRVPFGMFDLCREELHRAFAVHSATH